MKILHLMLSNFYIDDALYQENILSNQNKSDGHDVEIIASTMTFNDDNSIKFIKPIEYYTKQGIKVTRVPYFKFINNNISEKIRVYKNLYNLIEISSPDIIYSHGIGGYFSVTIARYIKRNLNVKLYIDIHSDYINSAKTFFSKYLLHYTFYRYCFWKYIKYVQKLYYIAPESIIFLKELYGFKDEDKLQYMPLGGYVIKESERIELRKISRAKLNIPENDIVFIHSGKLSAIKKSLELFKAFTKIKSDKIWLVVSGVFDNDVFDSVKSIINNDKRILFLGWNSSKDLKKLLCASDVYIQPGARSVSVQTAVCHGCGLITNPSLVYTHLFGDLALYISNQNEIELMIIKILNTPEIIVNQKKALKKFAENNLDYSVLANDYILN